MNLVTTAIDALRNGDRQRALSLLAQTLQSDPRDGRAWLWLAAAHPEAQRKIFCLEKALALGAEPSGAARKALAGLRQNQTPAALPAIERFLLQELEAAERLAPAMDFFQTDVRTDARNDEPPAPEAPAQPYAPPEALSKAPFVAPSEAPSDAPSLDYFMAEQQPEPYRWTEEPPAAEPPAPDHFLADRLAALEPQPSQALHPDAPPAVHPAPLSIDPNKLTRDGKPFAKELPKSRRTGPRGAGCSCLLLLLTLLVGTALGVFGWVQLQPRLAQFQPQIERIQSQLGLQALGVGPTLTATAVIPTSTPRPGVTLPATWTPTPSRPASATPLPTGAISTRPTGSPAVFASVTPLAPERLIVIGRSVEGRPIEVYRFGQGRRERLIIAGIHGGDEQNTIQLAEQLIDQLQRNPERVPTNMSLYILRALNPDGEAQGQTGRLNANGVDLNRNFPIGWKQSWVSLGCSSPPGTAGPFGGSEPETRALMDFLETRSVEMVISYHSFGLGIFPAGSPEQPESVRLAKGIAAITDYGYPPLRSECEYTGTLVDFAAANGAAAVDLELNSPTESELAENLKVLDLVLEWNLPTPTPVLPTQATTATPTPRPRATRTPATTPAPVTPATPTP